MHRRFPAEIRGVCCRNRNNIFALGQHPSERELCRRAFLLASNLANTLQEIGIALKIVSLKSRCRKPEIVLRQILRFF